jgi:hypothetical protein
LNGETVQTSKIVLLLTLCSILAAQAGALGKRDAPEQAEETLTIRGRVRLVGSMPFPSLVITDAEDHDWYVEDADRELLQRHEQRFVTVEGRPEYEDLVLANGEKIGVRRYLRNIRFIKTG